LCMYILFAIVAIFNFNINLEIKVKPNDSLTLFAKENRPQLLSLLLICAMFCICWIAYIQWESTIASFTQQINISMGQYSLLWTVNGILILVAQPLISPIIRLLKGNLKYQMYIGIAIFILSFFVTSFAQQFSIFMIGMVILSLGEMFVWPAVPAIAHKLAPTGKEGAYQGYVNSASTIGKAIGPVFGGVIVDTFNMQIMFLAMMALLFIALGFVYLFGKADAKYVKND
ncbi:MFS transporter, partial [Staphylococcus arlettae]